MKLRFSPIPNHAGSILPMALISLAVMAMVAAAALYRVQPHVASTYHSASWNDALNSAEAGADLALATLNLSETDPATAWAAWTPNDATTFPKTWVPPIAPHIGDGNTKAFCRLTVDNAITDVNGTPWMRVRSVGVAELPAASRSGMEGALLDVNGNKSFRAVLRHERYSSDVTAGTLTVPQVVRTIEAIAAPPGARAYARALTSKGPIVLNGAAHVDSFDSSDPAKSTGQLYDVAKRREKGAIGSNTAGSASNLGGCIVRGDASCNGSQMQNASNVMGNEFNNFFTAIPDVPVPSWTSFNFTPTAITNPGSPTILVGGSAISPQFYRLSDLTLSSSAAPLILAPHATGVESFLKIWITGRTTISGSGYVEVQPGVHAEFYVQDEIAVGGGSILNQTLRAQNVIIFGVTPPSGYRAATFSGSADFIGLLHAPRFNFLTTGSGKFSGSAICQSATLNSSGGFHYDENLANYPSQIRTGYQYASWIEDVN